VAGGAYPSAEAETRSITGKVIDGYITNATVFADCNNNTVFDPEEAKVFTDENGTYNLTFEDTGNCKIVAMGGTDKSTGEPFAGILMADSEDENITPLTTFVVMNPEMKSKLENYAKDYIGEENVDLAKQALVAATVIKVLYTSLAGDADVIKDALNKIAEKMAESEDLFLNATLVKDSMVEGLNSTANVTDLSSLENTLGDLMENVVNSAANMTGMDDLNSIRQSIQNSVENATDELNNLVSVGTNTGNFVNENNGTVSVNVTITDNRVSLGNITIANNTIPINHGDFDTVTTNTINGTTYDEVKNNLRDVFDMHLTVENSIDFDRDERIEVGILVKDKLANRFLLVFVPSHIYNENGVAKLIEEAGWNMTMIGKQADGDILKATRINEDQNIYTATTVSGIHTWEIESSRIWDKFASSDTPFGEYIRNLITRTVTNSGIYDIYVFTNNDLFVNGETWDFDYLITDVAGILNNNNAYDAIRNAFCNSTNSECNLYGFYGTIKIVE
jgi:hypothetical protein